jgi:carnitine O-palmitoyltransferase 1
VFLAKNQVFSSFFDSDILLVFLDKLIHYADSHHIAVYHKGRWFKVLMFYKNSLLQPCELQLYVFVFDFLANLVFRQLDEIIRDTTPPAYGEERLGVLTATERTIWCEAREMYFSTGVNRSSLEAIEKAAFVLILDDEEYEIGIVSLIQDFFKQKILLFNQFSSIRIHHHHQ